MNVSGGSCDVRSIPNHTRELPQLHYSFYVKNVKTKSSTQCSEGKAQVEKH